MLYIFSFINLMKLFHYERFILELKIDKDLLLKIITIKKKNRENNYNENIILE